MTKRILCALLFVLSFVAVETYAAAQVRPAGQIRFGPTDPAICTPGRGQIFENTTTHTVKNCTATNTWTATGGSGNVSTAGLTPGTLPVALTPTALGDSHIVDAGDLTIDVGGGDILLKSTGIGTTGNPAPLLASDTGRITTGVITPTWGGFGVDVTGQTGIALNTTGTFSWLGASGTGNVVRVSNATLIAPTLGVASATSINKLTITQPATGSTLTIPDGVTLNAGVGGTLGSNAFTSTAYAPIDNPTFTTNIATPTASIGFGATAPPSGPLLAVATTISTSPRGIASMQFSSDSAGARMGFFKAGGTIASPSAITSGWTLGRLMFRGYVGATNTYVESASIEAISSGTVADTSTGRLPSSLVFSTSTDASPSVLTARLTIDNAGLVTVPGSVTIGAGSAITSSGAGGALGSNAFTSTAYAASGANSDITSLSGVTAITGGASNMTITSGTGNSRTMILRTTTSGGTATTFLTGNADQSVTIANGITVTANPIILNNAIYTGTSAASTSSFNAAFGASGFLGTSGYYFGFASSASQGNLSPDTMLTRNAAGIVQVGTTAANALGSIMFVNATATGTFATSSTTDSTTTTSGALQIAGGAAIRKRVFIDGITASSGLQTAVLCQSSGGEMIADSVACLASSARFKENIKPLSSGLDEVMRLRPVSYRYKSEGIFAKNVNFHHERVGFTAEDVAKVDARFVGYEADGITPRTIGYDTMVPLLTKAIQEQQLMLEQQSAAIHMLESRIKTLMTRH